jgi:LPXTG-site transpeptidase (sortase) family protein
MTVRSSARAAKHEERAPARSSREARGAGAGTGPRSSTPLIALLVLVGLFAAAIGLGQLLGLPSLGDLMPAAKAAPEPGGALRHSVPTKISIPSLGVRAKVVQVGRAPDGSIDTPSSDAATATGWYSQGPTPGEPGTAVIVGHVDTQTKAAVFHKLSELRTGKLIEVKREDRRVATFTVQSVETFPKTAFPAQKVFQPAEKPRLVLVTCGGAWVGGQIGYADNVVVFATLT